MEDKEIDFIAGRYRRGTFNAASGWRRLGIAPVSGWRRYRVAAAVAATVILSATATILYREFRTADVPRQTVTVTTHDALAEVKVINFENAPLQQVVEKIEAVYDVRVEGLPSSSEGYELSLHYEGTPTDLIAVINDILGTEMTVTEK